MNFHQYGWCLPLAALLLVGCRNDPYLAAHIETVNAEYRQLEDQLYQAEEEKNQLAANVARLEAENRRLRGGGEPAPRRGMRGIRPAAPVEDDGLAPPTIEMGADEPPAIEMPGPGASEDSPYPTPIPRDRTPAQPTRPFTNPPPERAPRRSSRIPLEAPAIELPTEDALPAEHDIETAPPAELPAPPAEPTDQQEPEPIDARVTHLFLNPLLTGGDDFDRQPGDDGLSILLEPRNQEDKYVPQAGAVSIVVLDPAKQGDAARVARWDFDLAATQQKLQRVAPSRGIHLQMPWPAKAPESNRLQLFVRYETEDGRKLQAEREIMVALPGQYSNRWTPRPPDRPRRTPAEVAAVEKPKPTVPLSEMSAAKAAVKSPAVVTAAPAKAPIAKSTTSTTQESPQTAAKSAPKSTPKQNPPLEAKKQRPEWRPYR